MTDHEWFVKMLAVDGPFLDSKPSTVHDLSFRQAAAAIPDQDLPLLFEQMPSVKDRVISARTGQRMLWLTEDGILG